MKRTLLFVPQNLKSGQQWALSIRLMYEALNRVGTCHALAGCFNRYVVEGRLGYPQRQAKGFNNEQGQSSISGTGGMHDKLCGTILTKIASGNRGSGVTTHQVSKQVSRKSQCQEVVGIYRVAAVVDVCRF